MLGGVFIYASLDKIAFPGEFARIVMNYRILPEKLAIYFAFLLPWVELFLGIFLLVGLFVRESALALSSLLFIFMIVLLIQSFNGTLKNCGCFSVSSAKPESPLILLCRDALFLSFGLLLLSRKQRRRAPL